MLLDDPASATKGDEKKGPLCDAFQTIVQSFKEPDGPERHDLVQFVDSEGGGAPASPALVVP